jgi:hypothetical protein
VLELAGRDLGFNAAITACCRQCLPGWVNIVSAARELWGRLSKMNRDNINSPDKKSSQKNVFFKRSSHIVAL